MAKTPNVAPAVATAAPQVVGGFTIEAGAAPAPTQRIGRGGGDNPYRKAIDALAAPEGDKVYQFFVPVTAPDAITDPAEREKATKENQRKMTNALTGHTRRAKRADASKNFAIRSVVENGVYGVRVFRIAPEATEENAA